MQACAGGMERTPCDLVFFLCRWDGAALSGFTSRATTAFQCCNGRRRRVPCGAAEGGVGVGKKRDQTPRESRERLREVSFFLASTFGSTI
jgi:hypothetical protein